MSEDGALSSRVAVVTGGGRGIGRAIAAGLARRGAAVAVTARTLDQLEETVAQIEAGGGRAIAIAADVTKADEVTALVDGVERRLGVVDVLVNNAAVVGPIGPLWENDPEEWWRCVEVGVLGPFLCTRAVLPGMMARGAGRIITVVSGYGLKPTPYFSSYASAKAAAIRLMDTVAAEAGAFGVTAFAVCPGTVRTAMTEHMMASPQMQKWVPDYREGAPTRFRPPEQTADLVAFLASGRGDALSGCVIDVSRDDVVEMAGRAAEIQARGLYALRLWKE